MSDDWFDLLNETDSFYLHRGLGEEGLSWIEFMHLNFPWQDCDNSRQIKAEKLPLVIPAMQMIPLVL